MENLSQAAEKRPVPRAELALEISRLVSRVLAGERIDTAASGDELALRFPDAGMTGEMIAEAVARAAGMVGMIRDGGAPDAPAKGAVVAADAVLPEKEKPVAPTPRQPRKPMPERPAKMPQRAGGNGAARMGDARPAAKADQKAEPRERPGIARGAVAAVRRAFFRS